MSVAERSTANAAQNALVTRLQAREDLAGALVQVGLVADDEGTEDERILIGSIDDLRRDPVADQGIFRETYTVTILIVCHRECASTDVAARGETSDRMWGIIAELEQELAGDQELADDVEAAHVQAIPTAITLPAHDGWYAKAVVEIFVSGLCLLA